MKEYVCTLTRVANIDWIDEQMDNFLQNQLQSCSASPVFPTLVFYAVILSTIYLTLANFSVNCFTFETTVKGEGTYNVLCV